MSTSPSTAFSTTLRPDLRETLMQFDLQADQAGMVGLRIAPVIEVDVPLGQYGKVIIKELLKNRDTRRQSDGAYNRGDGKGTKDSYATEEHGFEEAVDEREAIVYGGWWDAEQLAADRARDAVIRNHNQRVIDLLTTTDLADAAAAVVWSTVASATPITDVRVGKIAVRNQTGVTPNAMVCDWEAFEYMRDCAQVIDRLKYAGFTNPNKESINEIVLAQALGLDEVIVSGSMKNSANENVAVSLGAQWDRTKALLFVKNTSRDTKKPRFANTFHWGADGSTAGGTFENYYDPARRRWIIRNRMETDEKLVYPELGYLITGVLS